MTVKNIAANAEMTKVFTSRTGSCSNDIQKNGKDFIGCMNNSSNNGQTDRKTDVGNTFDGRGRSDSTKSANAKNINQLEYDVLDGSFAVSVVEPLEDSVLMSEEELIDAIGDIVCDKLGITKEEFKQKLADMDINEISLLQTDVLKQFFMNVNDLSDMMDLLTDEELSAGWNQLFGALTELAKEISPSLQRIITSDDVTKIASDSQGQEETSDGMENIKDEKFISNVTGEKESADRSESFADDDKMMGGRDDFNESMFDKFISRMQESLSETGRFNETEIRQIRDISFQIIEGIKTNVKSDTSSMELMLNPESLGKVNVSIVVRDGIATAQFAVRNELCKAAIESQIQTLKETFEQQGIKVEAIEVTVSDFSFENRQQTFEQEKGKNAGRSISGESQEEFAEEAESETVEDGGINLTA